MIQNCEMNANGKAGIRLIFDNGSNNKKWADQNNENNVFMTACAKDITVSGCAISNAHQVMEIHSAENITVANNTFSGISNRDIMITTYGDGKLTGKIAITGNESTGGENRFVRIGNAGDAQVVIKGNIIKNYCWPNNDYIRVSELNVGNEPTIEGNTATDGTNQNRTLTHICDYAG